MNWNKLFNYVNGELFWKIKVGTRALPGNTVGNLNSHGYLQFNYNRKSHKVHRIIWEMHNGAIPTGMQVDHIDHNRLNNLLTNLRLVSNKDNSRNQSKRVTNSSGVTGVYWHSRDNVWTASIHNEGKLINLGSFAEKENAINARKKAELIYGYHKNHGDA